MMMTWRAQFAWNYQSDDGDTHAAASAYASVPTRAYVLTDVRQYM